MCPYPGALGVSQIAGTVGGWSVHRVHLGTQWGLVKSSPKAYRSHRQAEAQWYLVEALSSARSHLGIRDHYEAKQNQISHFAGVLAGFRYLGAITQEEEQAWYRKMLVALGDEAPDPAPPGVSRAGSSAIPQNALLDRSLRALPCSFGRSQDPTKSSRFMAEDSESLPLSSTTRL
jgi:hypothetical protein